MKKYLMTGIAAIALCAAFTSCSRDFEAPTEEELAQIEAQKAFTKYENAFTTAFGQPAADQDWGFGSLPSEAEARGITRSVDYVLLDQDPTQPNAPAQPEFSSKPTAPTFNTTVPTGTPKASKSNWADNGTYYIDNDYVDLENPQNKSNVTLYANGTNVTYQYATNQNGNGTTIIVTENSTLTLTQVGNNLSVYLAPGATLNVPNGATFKKSTAMLYLSSTSTLNCTDADNKNRGVIFEENYTVLNDGGTIHVDTVTVDGGALLYNDGTLTAEVAVVLKNQSGELINNNRLTVPTFDQRSGGKFLNDEEGVVEVDGMTYLTNLNCVWQNKGVYTTGDMDIENTRRIYNNCKLTVTADGTSGTGTFHFIKNSAFVLDGQASVKTDKMIWDDDCDFYMKDNSLLWVVGRLLAKNDDKGYGAHGLGTGYSVIKANSIEYESGKQSRMNYWGKIFVDTDSHFPQGFDDPSNQYTGASQPHYYYSTKNKTVMFKFLGDACPVSSIDSGKCHHGYTPPTPPTPPVNLTSLRVMAEDLSASQASDFDFNDVVFDVEYVDDGHAKITLRAAGGTLPLKINSTNGEGGWEVHEMFDVPVNTMVNTNAQLKNLTYADKPAVVLAERFEGDFTRANFAQTVKNIRVEVYKSKTWMLLEANQGVACCKFGCSLDKKWVDERRNIDSFYRFSDWVQGFTTTLTKKGNW